MLSYEEQILAGCSTPGLRRRSTDGSVPERDLPEKDIPAEPISETDAKTNIVKLADVKGEALSEEQEELVFLLENCLKEAKQGAFGALAVVYVRPNGVNMGSSIPNFTRLNGLLLGATVSMQHHLLEMMGEVNTNREDEPEGPSPA
jgi:hypothetical protein